MNTHPILKDFLCHQLILLISFFKYNKSIILKVSNICPTHTKKNVTHDIKLP